MQSYTQTWAKWGRILPLVLFFTLNAFNTKAQLSGTYTVGSSGNYSTLTAAVSALNTSGISGAVTLVLTDASYSSSETFPIIINQISGANASRRITIRPAASVNATITGSTATGTALIRLAGTDFITIDGSNTRGGSTRNLSIINTSTATNTAAIWVSSLGTGSGASKDSIKNVNIMAGSNSVTSTFGIYAAGTTISTTGTGADNDTLTIENNHISRAYYGIYARGVSSTGLLNNLLITKNLVGNDSANNYVTYRGIDLQNTSSPEISRNTIFNLKLATSVNNAAIDLGQYNSNAIISGNQITGIYSTSSGGWGAYGINISSATGNSGITIVNNMISDIITSNYSATSLVYNAFGIRITGGTDFKIYYNSVHLSGAPTTGTTGTISAAFIVTVTTATGLDIRNNVFSNTMEGLSGAKSYAIYLAGTANYSTINYNNYWAGGTYGVLGRIGANDYSTISSWRTATSQDANSINANPQFYSTTNLHVTGISLNSAAIPISGITSDFDGQARNTSTPDIGADEFTPPANDAGVVSIDNPVSPFVSGSRSVSVTIRNFGTATLNSVIVNWSVNGVAQPSRNFSRSLTTNTSDTVNLGNINFQSGTLYTIKAWTSSPNNSTDGLAFNDTSIAIRTSALSGTFTVGTGKNFATLTSAVNTLNTAGVSGAVTFLLTDTAYKSETFPVTINQVTGASASNRITIRPAGGVNAKITGSSASSILKLNGADFVTIDGSNTRGGTTRNLSVINTNTAINTAAIWISSLGVKAGARHDSIKNLNIMAGIGSVTSVFGIHAGGTSISTSGTGADNDTLTIQNNNISRAYYGIYARGVATSGTLDKLIITQNIIGSDNPADYVLYRGVDVVDVNAPEISRNTIFNLKLATSVNNAAIDLGPNNPNAVISRNFISGIHSTTSSGYGAYGINISSATGNSGIKIVNNMISDIITSNYSATSTTYNAFGIRITGGTGYKIYYNSVHLSGKPSTGTTGTLSSAFIVTVTTATGLDIRNNVFSNTMEGLTGAKSYAVYLAGTANITTINYNNYWINGAAGIFGYIGSDISTLSGWQTATSQDANSISADPKFASNTDLHSVSVAMNNAGTPISGFTEDFDGQARSTTTPDISADEFTPPANDLQMLAIISPLNNTCGDSFTRVGVVFSNNGTNSQSSFTIGAKVTGSATQTLSYSYSKTLNSSAKDTVYFTSAINSHQGGTFNISAYTTLSTDQNRNNDTVKTSVKLNALPAGPTASGANICSQNSVQLVAGKPTGATVEWFTSAAATTPVFTGDTFKTPVLTSNTTYYIASTNKKGYTVGPGSNAAVSTSGGYVDYVYALTFDVTKAVTIDSVAVFAGTTGQVEVELLNSSNSLITSTKVNVSVTNTKVFIPLGFQVQPGTGYKLQLASTTATLYRNTSGASYPYTNTGILSITGNTFDPAYYYYFYDWHLTSSGCPSQRVPVKVTVNKSPGGVSFAKGTTFNGSYNAGTAADPDKVCADNTIIYQLTPPTGLSNAGFGTTWSITKLTFATANGTIAKDTLLTKPSSAGNGTLRFTPDNSFADSTLILNITVKNLISGCDTSFTRYVSVGFQPKANFGFTNVCGGRMVNFSDSSISNTSTVYKYYFGDGNTSAVKSPMYYYPNSGTYNVSLVVTNQGVCKDSVVKQVTVYPMPKAGFSADDACGTSNLKLTNTSSISSGTLSYIWHFGDGDTSSALNPSHTYASPGMYNVKLIVTSNNGCKDSISKAVAIFAAPTAGFTSNSSACAGQFIRFTDASSVAGGGIAREWSFGDGNTSLATNPLHVYAAPGTYKVQLKVMTVNGCVDSISKTITVNATPDADFSAVTTSCSRSNVQFTDASTIAAGTIVSYQWNFGDGKTSALKNPAYKFAKAGTYLIKLVVTSNTGCKDSMSRQILINESPVAGFVAVSICSDQSAQFIDSSSVAGSTIVGRTWYFGDGNTSNSTNPTHQYANAGTYNVKLVVNSANGCKDSFTKSISIYDMPVAGFTTADVCQGTDAIFTNTSTINNGTLSYFWNFGDSATSTAKSPVHKYSAPGTYRITLLAVSANQCADTFSSVINVLPAPNAEFTYKVSGGRATFTPADTTLVSYGWNFGDGNTSSQLKPEHIYTKNGLFNVSLKVKGTNGCVVELFDTVRIRTSGIYNEMQPEILLNISPNPFREQTSISYTLERKASVKAVVYDMAGKEIAVITDQNQVAGKYSYTLDAETHHMNSGIYLLRIIVDDKLITKQIIRLK